VRSASVLAVASPHSCRHRQTTLLAGTPGQRYHVIDTTILGRVSGGPHMLPEITTKETAWVARAMTQVCHSCCPLRQRQEGNMVRPHHTWGAERRFSQSLQQGSEGTACIMSGEVRRRHGHWRQRHPVHPRGCWPAPLTCLHPTAQRGWWANRGSGHSLRRWHCVGTTL